MIRTVAPTELAVDIQAARDNLRVDGDHMDSLITTWVKGITRQLEHDVGQCFMEQTWQVRLPAFPDAAGPIKLPHPAMEIVSVAWSNSTDATVALLVGTLQPNVAAYSSTITPARGMVWPAGAADVVITVKCGYGSTPDKTPETAQLFILGKLVEQYDPITRVERDTVQSRFLDGLVDDLRCYA